MKFTDYIIDHNRAIKILISVVDKRDRGQGNFFKHPPDILEL